LNINNEPLKILELGFKAENYCLDRYIIIDIRQSSTMPHKKVRCRERVKEGKK
jgi:hypothetical protein